MKDLITILFETQAVVAEYLISLHFFHHHLCDFPQKIILIFMGNLKCHCTNLEKIDWIQYTIIVKVLPLSISFCVDLFFV